MPDMSTTQHNTTQRNTTQHKQQTQHNSTQLNSTHHKTTNSIQHNELNAKQLTTQPNSTQLNTTQHNNNNNNNNKSAAAVAAADRYGESKPSPFSPKLLSSFSSVSSLYVYHRLCCSIYRSPSRCRTQTHQHKWGMLRQRCHTSYGILYELNVSSTCVFGMQNSKHSIDSRALQWHGAQSRSLLTHYDPHN